MKTVSNITVQFSLKTPKHGRGTFSVVRREVDRSSLKSKNKTLALPELDAINLDYKNNPNKYDVCFRHARSVIEQLYKDLNNQNGKTVYTSENLEIVEKYWDKVGRKKDISSHKASKNRLLRAIGVVGNLSLYSASLDDIQACIDKRTKGNKQRDTISVIHQLFTFIGRKERLIKVRPEVRYPLYLRREEFEKLLPHLKEQEQLVFKVAFATGCRLGEIFALKKDQYIRGLIDVVAQMDEQGVVKETKTRLNRRTVVLDFYKPALDDWLNISFEDRFKIRNLAWSKICRKACAKAGLGKVCVFHDLRHSFAVYLRDNGGSANDIANALGNGLAVTEKSYIGKVGSDQSLENLRRLIHKQA